MAHSRAGRGLLPIWFSFSRCQDRWRIALWRQFACDLAALAPTIRPLTPASHGGRTLALCFSKGVEAGCST